LKTESRDFTPSSVSSKLAVKNEPEAEPEVDREIIFGEEVPLPPPPPLPSRLNNLNEGERVGDPVPEAVVDEARAEMDEEEVELMRVEELNEENDEDLEK